MSNTLSNEELFALLSTDQVAFTQQCFHTVDPAHEYLHNWHIDCLPYESLIQTEDGLLSIGYIVESHYTGLVASFNHQDNSIEWKKITQYITNPCAPLFELVYTTGESLKITGNHPVWANGEYINAEKLQEGDSSLRILPECVSGYSVGENKVLWEKMLWKEQDDPERHNLSHMRGGKALSFKALPSLRQGVQKKWQRISMWLLRQTNIHGSSKICRSKENEGSFLWEEVFRKVRHWFKQSRLHRWQAWRRLPQTRISPDKKEGSEKGWASLFPVQRKKGQVTFGYTSHRPGQDKQRIMESCNSLPKVSQQAEGNTRRNLEFGECFVQEITRCTQLPDKTYNLEVEGHNNYFANGILVHNCIIEHLQAIERGEIRRLVINMPPRSLKSITTTVAWPAWLLGRNPSAQIITASYAYDLSIKHSVDTRLVMESPWYKKCFPETIIAADQNEKRKFQTTKRGHRKATSVGGSVTGEGGDYLIVDDPLKPDEALTSEVTRINTNAWIDQTFLTRENDPKTSRALLTMQRLHMDDVAGHLIERGWKTLILPAYFERKTIIEVNKKKWICEQDSYLHEERIGEDELDAKLQELGMQGFVGQYLQRPSPEGGGEFQRRYVQYYNNFSRKFTSHGMNTYILYDPANSKKNKQSSDPDYTAMVVVGLAPDNNYYILDLVRDRLNPTERVNMLFDLHMKWSKLSGKPPRVAIEQYGMMTDSFYMNKEMDERNYRFPIVEVKGQIKKEDRIRKLIPLFENGRVYLPRQILYDSIDGSQQELAQKFVKDELLVFPVGRHDDMLDALARIVDKDLNANFPKIGTVYLQGGQTLKDLYNEDFDENDIMTW